MAHIPLDTPVTQIKWNRGPFGLNIFRLNLARSLSSKAYFSLGFLANKADSQSYNYVFQVHQPYLSGIAGLKTIIPSLERDSSSLVIEGVMPRIENLHFRPRLGYWFSKSLIMEIFLDRYTNNSDLELPQSDSSAEGHEFYREAIQQLYSGEFSNLSLGSFLGFNGSYVKGQIGYNHSTFVRKEGPFTYNYNISDSSNTGIKTYFNQLEGSANSLSGALYLHSFSGAPNISFNLCDERFNAPLYVDTSLNVNLINFNQEAFTNFWGDDERVTLSYSPSLSSLTWYIQTGWSRHSYIHNKIEQDWFGSFKTELKFKPFLTFNAFAGQYAKYPDWEDLYTFNIAQSRYANPNLSRETHQFWGGDFIFDMHNFYITSGYTNNTISDVILPVALPLSGLPPADYKSSIRKVNYQEEIRGTWHIGASFNLGMWQGYLHHYFLFDNYVSDINILSVSTSPNFSLPESVYKGHLEWNGLYVKNRLHVKVCWDWEWFSERYAWAPQFDGTSTVTRLDEYLVLDFQATMEIKSFSLFYQIKNMNHDRYYLKPGSHPPGVNFRWGVLWTLAN